MKRLRILIMFVLLFVTVVSLAQPIVVKGTILDAKSHEPIVEVEIINLFTSRGSTSDKAGKFSISLTDTNKTKLSFHHLAYETKTIQVNSFLNQETAIILLDPKTENLDEFSIIGQFENDKPYRIEYLNQKNIAEAHSNDIGALLRKEPNISGIKKGALGIDPVVRGLKYSQLNVQLNSGVKIEGGCPNRMDPAIAHVDLNDLQGITILKGPFGLKYGPNFGGVLNLRTQRLTFYQTYETHVSALMGAQTNQEGYKTKVRVNGGGGKLAYDFSGNWKKYGDYTAGNGETVQSSFQQYNLTGKIGFKPADGHTIEFGIDRSWGRNIDFPALPMDERSDDTYIYDLDYLGTQIGKTINFIRAKVYRSDVHHIMDNKNRPFSDTVVSISDIRASNTGARFGINMNLWKGRLEVGGEYERITKDGERTKTLIMQPGLPVKVEDLWNNALIQNGGIFAEFQKQSHNIEWIAAVRMDLNSATSNPLLREKPNGDNVYQNENTSSQFTNFSASAGLTWHINASNELLFSMGSGTRSPDMVERFIILLPIGYDPYDYLGNPLLKPENNNEIDLGYRLTKNKVGQIYLSGFFSLLTNYIYSKELPPSVVKPQTPGVLGVKQFINIDYAYLTGFELTYSTPQKYDWKLHFNAAYTFGINPTVNGNDPLAEIPPFESNLNFSYSFFGNQLVPELSLRMVAVQNRVSIDYNESPSQAFTTLDFKLRYQFSKNLNVFAGVSNIFNTAYYEHLNRNIIGSTLPLYEVGRVFYLDLIIKL
ncbi:MAG: hypothetical protein DRI89_03660 [Bacteroidetes bacterium]|nr:MAG: hypothetical protein DRI89_03660 [Bacteroidota bacterium]